MCIEIKVSLGEMFITTTQDDKELAIKEATETVSNEIGLMLANSSQYEIVGDNYGDEEEGK
jgi:hypothetical protein